MKHGMNIIARVVRDEGINMGYAGMNIIARVAMDEGMDHYVFVAYKEAVATMTIPPFA